MEIDGARNKKKSAFIRDIERDPDSELSKNSSRRHSSSLRFTHVVYVEGNECGKYLVDPEKETAFLLLALSGELAMSAASALATSTSEEEVDMEVEHTLEPASAPTEEEKPRKEPPPPPPPPTRVEEAEATLALMLPPPAAKEAETEVLLRRLANSCGGGQNNYSCTLGQTEQCVRTCCASLCCSQNDLRLRCSSEVFGGVGPSSPSVGGGAKGGGVRGSCGGARDAGAELA